MTRDAATMIRFHSVNGMSRTQLERIYGRDAVLRVLGPADPAAVLPTLEAVTTRARQGSGSRWTPEQDARLKALLAQGLTAAEAGEQLKVSKNAVIARSKRLREAIPPLRQVIRRQLGRGL